MLEQKQKYKLEINPNAEHEWYSIEMCFNVEITPE